MKNEAFLPKKSFSGSSKNKLGPAAQLKGGMKRPARQGDLVGEENEDQRLDPKCWKGYRKQGTKMKGDTRVNNCVKVKEGFEDDELIVLYINGKPKTKYENIHKAREDARFLKGRFPDIDISLKRVSTAAKPIDESWEKEIARLVKILESK